MIPTIKSLNIASLGLALMLSLSSCRKDEPEPQQPQGPVNPAAPFFRWQLDQGAVVTADSAYALEASHVIFAFENVGGSIEVNLDNMDAGSHEISPAKGNQLHYIEDQAAHEANGSFVISESTASKLSGNFSCNFTAGPFSTITGTFSGIPKK